jgi:hypothetical protein
LCVTTLQTTMRPRSLVYSMIMSWGMRGMRDDDDDDDDDDERQNIVIDVRHQVNIRFHAATTRDTSNISRSCITFSPLPAFPRQKLGCPLGVALAADVSFPLRHVQARRLAHLPYGVKSRVDNTSSAPTLHTSGAFSSLLLGIASAAAAFLSLPAKSRNTGTTAGAVPASHASMKPRCCRRSASATLRCTPLLRARYEAAP